MLGNNALQIHNFVNIAIVTILYNLIVLAIDLVALFRVSQSKSAPSWCLVVTVAILAEMLVAAFFAKDRFDLCRLGCYLVFLHGFVLSAGFALIVWPERKKTAVSSVLCAAGLPVLAYFVFLVEPFWLEVTYRQIADPKITTPLRIAVLADLQTDNFGDYEQAALRRVMQEKPDLILLAGDYIQTPYERYPALGRQLHDFLLEIRFAAPCGVFAVQGNVDPPAWPDIFADSGVTCVNLRKSFDLGPISLTCLGLSDSFNTASVMKNPHPGKFHLVLGHAPDFALGRVEADLLIAGHTHGGQVRLPLIGPLITISRVPHTWAAGLTILSDGGKLLVSRGVGMERGYAPRVRFSCRPELMIIDLLPQKTVGP